LKYKADGDGLSLFYLLYMSEHPEMNYIYDYYSDTMVNIEMASR